MLGGGSPELKLSQQLRETKTECRMACEEAHAQERDAHGAGGVARGARENVRVPANAHLDSSTVFWKGVSETEEHSYLAIQVSAAKAKVPGRSAACGMII